MLDVGKQKGRGNFQFSKAGQGAPPSSSTTVVGRVTNLGRVKEG